MARDWETWLRNSIGPASATEEADRDRTEKRVRDAVMADRRLAGNVRVFVKGSYANNTNVRRDSDVDIGVEWKSWSYISRENDARGRTWEELGVTTNDTGPQPPEYRRWVEEALLDAFGASTLDATGNTAITVVGGSTTLDADVVPCFRHMRYDGIGRSPHVGTRLYPNKGTFIDNWPEQHRVNGTGKNSKTGRRYKELVRAIKRLETDMVTTGRLQKEVHGYFLECLLYNLRNQDFMYDSYKRTAGELLASLWTAIDKDGHADWVEVNGLKWLWRDGQTWTPAEASDLAYKAWNYIKSG